MTDPTINLENSNSGLLPRPNSRIQAKVSDIDDTPLDHDKTAAYSKLDPNAPPLDDDGNPLSPQAGKITHPDPPSSLILIP